MTNSLQKLSDETLEREWLTRKSAKSSLLRYTEYTNPRYIAAPHHAAIAYVLEKALAGEITRLIIKAPPRHGKSELATVRFPAWLLGQRPDVQIVSASYNADLAVDFGKKVRALVRDERHRNVFPASELKQDSQAANLWHTSAGGVYRTVGIKGGTTGFGADVLLIDDPIKDRKEADSATFREDVWQWYVSAAYTRLMPGVAPGGIIVLTYTPWHEDDLGHRILEQAQLSGERWHVLSLPALAEVDDPLHRAVGEALWPERYPKESLEQIRLTIGQREFSALYQCRPQPEGGRYFERSWFRYYEPDSLPRGCRFYLSSDWAVTEEESADFTVHQVWAYIEPNLYLVDQYRDQREADVTIDAALDLCQQYKPLAWINEKGQLNRAIRPFLTKRMRERRVTTRLIDYARTADKEVTARSIQAMCSSGRVFLPASGGFVQDVLSEWLRFPAGAHDDTVDPAALLGQHLEQIRSTPRDGRTSFVGKTPFAPGDSGQGFSPFGR